MTALPLVGIPRDYAWGSRTSIQQLLGTAPDGEPLAELWFGDHSGDPARVPSLDTTLDQVIAGDPRRMLGEGIVGAYGEHLPFLLKILAAERALSIQVHPTRAQAEAAFAAGDPNYTDANHKPELLCALTPFEALCGFRTEEMIAALIDAVAIDALRPVSEALSGPDGLRAAFTAVLSLGDPAAVARELAVRADQLPPDAARAVELTSSDFPGDVGVIVSLLLNHVVLDPGEAIFLGAGNVHAYLRGTGVEIMASSDNVLRCGLTRKRIDVPELLKITDFTSLLDPRWPAAGDAFVVPVPDFRLSRHELAGALTSPAGSPRIVLCTAGACVVDDVAIGPAHAAYIPAADTCVLDGVGTVFVASTAG